MSNVGVPIASCSVPWIYRFFAECDGETLMRVSSPRELTGIEIENYINNCDDNFSVMTLWEVVQEGNNK